MATPCCGIFCVTGLPNAGKSTFINRWVGKDVCASSRKIHTTRQTVKGIVTWEHYQVILVDTPGLESVKPRDPFAQAVQRQGWSALDSADHILFFIDSVRPDKEEAFDLLQRVRKQCSRPLSIVLNKVDRVAKDRLLDLAQYFSQNCHDVFMISALKNQGMQSFQKRIEPLIPTRAWKYASGDVTAQSLEFWASEITREMAFSWLHQEIPYGLHVITESWKKNRKGIVLHQKIVLEQAQHKALVLGKGGQRIKDIGTHARKKMQNLWQCPVYLHLHVQIAPRWKERWMHHP